MGLPTINGEHVQALTPGATQTVTVDASSTTSGSTIGPVARLVADVACHVAFGASPTAGTDDMYLPANTVQLVAVPNGTSVAVIRASSDGILWVTDMS